MTTRRFWMTVSVLLAAMAAIATTVALDDSQTMDEGIHLLAGYAYLKTGDYRLDPEHPPLGVVLNALPLLAADPALPPRLPAWDLPRTFELSQRFVFGNHVSADRMMFLGRLPTIVLTVLLGLALAGWTRRHFGTAPALLAVFLLAFDPNLIAHGHLVTNDLVLTLLVFVATVAWADYLETGQRNRLLAAGVLTGMAFAAKFSALFLPLLYAVLYRVRWVQSRQGGRADSPPRAKFSLARGVYQVAAITAIGVLVLCLAYVPATLSLPPNESRLADLVDRQTLTGRALGWLGSAFDLRAQPLLMGFNAVANHARRGHRAYLMGSFSTHGWLSYFPVALAVKTPLAVLLLLGLLALYGAGRFFGRADDLPLPWFVATISPAVYLLLALFNPLNIGLRHVLPVYPFLFAVAAAALFKVLRGVRVRVAAVALVAALHLFEAATIYPHHLAFFNLAAGGPADGARYLLDSNLDWGQDLRRLGRYLASHKIDRVCLAYFGTADPVYYGVRPLRRAEVAGGVGTDCVAAVSANYLFGLYATNQSYDSLRRLEPMDRIGYSIYLYDFRLRK
jgi:hypothetical protein